MRECLSSLADIHYGKSPLEVSATDGQYPIVGTGGVYGQADRALFKEGVVVARKGSLGKPHLHRTPFWPADTTYAVVPHSGVSIEWLYYCLLDYDLTKLNEATGVPSINRNWLSKIEFENPGSKGQARIATILTSIDTAIEKTEALIAKYQKIKAGLMHDLFTRGVLPNGQLRPPRELAQDLYGLTELGWLPSTWGVTQLGLIATVSRGKFTHRPRNDPAFFGGPHPFIQTGDVAASGGSEILTYSQTLSERGIDVSQLFPKGTIAITIAANIADTGILGVPMYFPDSVVGAVVADSENHRFVELCIRRAKPRLEALAPQSAQKNINLQDLRPLRIPRPMRDEQDRIASKYEAIQAKIDAEIKTSQKLGLKKLGLMQDLLTGKVPVKLSPELLKVA